MKLFNKFKNEQMIEAIAVSTAIGAGILGPLGMVLFGLLAWILWKKGIR